jgi:hypothetical protein
MAFDGEIAVDRATFVIEFSVEPCYSGEDISKKNCMNPFV